MDLDIFTAFIFGCFLGGVLGYLVCIVRYMRNDLDELVVAEHEKNESGSARFLTFQNFAVMSILLILGLSLFYAQRNSNDIQANYAADEKARCEAGVDTRTVQRDLVEAIYDLATSFIDRDQNAPPLTAEERIRYNAYVGRLNEFRESMYANIKPSELCAPYVSDDNVKPPTPSYPLLP